MSKPSTAVAVASISCEFNTTRIGHSSDLCSVTKSTPWTAARNPQPASGTTTRNLFCRVDPQTGVFVLDWVLGSRVPHTLKTFSEATSKIMSVPRPPDTGCLSTTLIPELCTCRNQLRFKACLFKPKFKTCHSYPTLGLFRSPDTPTRALGVNYLQTLPRDIR